MYVDPKRNQQAGNLAWILPYCKPDLPRVAGARPDVDVVRRVGDDRSYRFIINHGGDDVLLNARGIDLVTGLCDQVLRGGAPGLQFFTLNRSTATAEILGRLRALP